MIKSYTYPHKNATDPVRTVAFCINYYHFQVLYLCQLPQNFSDGIVNHPGGPFIKGC